MRRKVFLFFALCLAVVCTKAQNMQDVVYLKNGSIIRGIIIEQVPNVSLKIRTGDGSIFAYNVDEVEKITKEQAQGTGGWSGGGWQDGNELKFGYRKDGNGLKAGYRGFVDFGGTIGTGTYGVSRVEVSNSHGYQFNPYIFFGVGFGYGYYVDSEVHEIPVFGHLRSEFLNRRVSPFFDFKAGYAVYDAMGFYMNPSVGCRIRLPRRGGISVSVGYTMQKLDGITYYYDYYYYDFYNEESKENFGGVTLKLSVDF